MLAWRRFSVSRFGAGDSSKWFSTDQVISVIAIFFNLAHYINFFCIFKNKVAEQRCADYVLSDFC